MDNPEDDLLDEVGVHVAIDFPERDVVTRHARVLHEFLAKTPNGSITAEVREALAYFRLRLHRTSGEHSASYRLYRVVGLPLLKSGQAQLQDTFDQMRELTEALRQLLRSIRDLNDLDSRDPDIMAARSYLSAMREFIDVELTPKPIAMPEAVPKGLLDILKRAKWAAMSSEANKWAETLIRLLTKLLG
jgi:hypothetical protein